METRSKYIGYIRVSTKGQADSGLSLEAQEQKIIAYAALYDIEVVRIEVDAGISAKTLDRPGLQRALTAMDGGEVEGIIIAKLDRLSRRVANTAKLMSKYFRDGKYHLLSIQDQFNTATAAGRFVVNIMASMAEMEADVISERTKTALQVLKDDGVKLGSLNYGFRREPSEDGQRMEIVPDYNENANIYLMRRLKQEGLTLRQIGTELQARGIKTKKGLVNWSPSTLHQILSRFV